MHLLDRFFRIIPALACTPMATAIAAWMIAAPAHAQTDAPYRALWPVPAAALTLAEPAEEIQAPADETALDPLADADTALFASAPMSARQARIDREAAFRAQRDIPLDIIRQGLSPQGAGSTLLPERIVGLKFGADVFAVSTRVVAPAGVGNEAQARIDWLLARRAGKAEDGLIWAASTGGGGAVSGRPEQTAHVMLGYRQPVFAHLTLTTQLAMVGHYVIAPGQEPHSSVVPEIQMSADLKALAGLPMEASFDLGLARQMPLTASDYETRASAMLRLRYALD
jgi:hypothetical protein